MEIQLRVRTIDGVALLDVAGEIDIYTFPKLESAIRDLLAGGRTRLVINLLETTYLDSTALRIFTTALREARRAGGNVGLVFTRPLVEKVFAITGLHEVLPVFRSEVEALQAARTW